MAKTTRFIHGLALAVFAILILHSATADARSNHKRAVKHKSHHSRAIVANPHYASVIMDAQTGRVLNQTDPNVSLPPASLTKMMTLFLTFEALENGRLHMNKYLTVSANATRQAPSRLGLKVGERITVKQAILAVVTRSANDVAFALAETIGGSDKRFSQMMNERARSLGMRNSYFANPTGLPNPQQKSSAYDMALLGRALMQYFPQHYHFFSTKFFIYNGEIITSHNNLMSRYPGMDGFKTGYTVASGFNLVSSAVKDNRRVIVSVFGGRTARARDDHVADLMNRGFDMMERNTPPVQVAQNSEDFPTPIQEVAAQTAQTTSTHEATKTTVANIAPTANKPAPAKQTTTIVASTTTIAPIQKAAPDTTFAYPESTSATQATTTATAAATTTLQPVTPSQQQTALQPVSYLPTTMNKGENWGIQIGAYTSPSLGQQALQIVQTRLKTLVASAQPVVIPSVTPQGTIYRARIIGMTAENAAKACQELSECMAFAIR